MRKHHVFFTTQYTQECLEQCCFGASVSNSLANVKAGDIAFLFDGLKWAIFGPFEIISDQQRIDKRPIYGKDKRGNVRYKNRVWFRKENAKETPMVKLYSTEREPSKHSFLLNRYIIATLIANKQVNATTLTQTEGQYLMEKCLKLGNRVCSPCSKIPPNIEPVFSASFLRRPISEAAVEVLILNKRCQGYLLEFLNSFSKQSVYFNQFILGFQRQADLLIDAQDRVALIEIKKAQNTQSPFEQLVEYVYYCLSSFRLHHNRLNAIESIDLVALTENGSRYLANDPIERFIRRCAEITDRENIKIIPHTVIYRVSSKALETKPYII